MKRTLLLVASLFACAQVSAQVAPTLTFTAETVTGAGYYDKGAKIDWNDSIAFGRIMGVVQCCALRRGIKLRFGLDWDGDFRSVGRDPDEHFLDAPHVELP